MSCVKGAIAISMLVIDEAKEVSDSEKLRRACRSGAKWFYWIAGLSVVNSILQLAGGAISFVIGLAITQVIAAIARGVTEGAEPGLARAVRLLAFVLALALAGLFVWCGWHASRQRGWAFVTGMLVYGLDGLLCLLFGDWMSFSFHVFALFFVWAGYSSMRKLHAIEAQTGVRPIEPGGA